MYKRQAVLGAPELLPLPFQAAVAGSRGLGTAAVEVPGSGSRIWSSIAAAIAIPGSSSWDEKLGHCCSCGSGTVTGVLIYIYLSIVNVISLVSFILNFQFSIVCCGQLFFLSRAFFCGLQLQLLFNSSAKVYTDSLSYLS